MSKIKIDVDAVASRMRLENPCAIGSVEWPWWELGAVHGLYGYVRLKDQAPAYCEGYEWGLQLRKEFWRGR